MNDQDFENFEDEEYEDEEELSTNYKAIMLFLMMMSIAIFVLEVGQCIHQLRG